MQKDKILHCQKKVSHSLTVLWSPTTLQKWFSYLLGLIIIKLTVITLPS